MKKYPAVLHFLQFSLSLLAGIKILSAPRPYVMNYVHVHNMQLWVINNRCGGRCFYSYDESLRLDIRTQVYAHYNLYEFELPLGDPIVKPSPPAELGVDCGSRSACRNTCITLCAVVKYL